MHGTHLSSFIRNAATLTIISILISGCLMGEEEAESGAEVATDNEVSGSVGDGPIVGATMRILRNDGVELSQLSSDADASYNITVKTKGKFYPLGVDARNGTDIVTNTAPDFDLLGAVLEPGKKSVANVNPFSTFAVELARDLPGGIDKTNLVTAQGIVTSEFNNGLSSLATSGVMTTKINGSNIAEIVRASEALGETVRRTRDALGASGFSTSGNNVVRALAADLTDRVVDGRGSSRADARFAAVWNIVSAQVLLETMANELHVNGADATDLMSNAINQVSVGTANPMLADLTVTADMLERARIGIVAAHAITSDSAIAELLTAVAGVQTGTGSSTIRTFALPSDYRSRLSNAVLLVAGGSTAELETVNDISRNQTLTIDSGPVAGSVTLSWAAPTRNEDGTTLTDLAGYKLYWGTTSGSYPNSVTINDKDATTFVVDNLSPGTYEFVATSFNTSGVESRYSAPATKVVP
uniref:Secreted protein n=1 Tax=uncultured bacterium ws198A12 TaxID=1131830 RepID=I1X5J8_9BACT|nr:secreted protein [uncultured bacterium ws198A12]